jgi:hypothetical protein
LVHYNRQVLGLLLLLLHLFHSVPHRLLLHPPSLRHLVSILVGLLLLLPPLLRLNNRPASFSLA